MHRELEFPDLLRLIEERADAFRAVVADAPRLDAEVPTCPGWTLLDLVRHVGEGRRTWGATVAAGPADARAAGPAPADSPTAEWERPAVAAWLAASTRQLVGALREAGPDRGCWTWWGTSQSPRTAGGVARHQLQEIALHTYDARIAVGARPSLPRDVALDGVEEFLFTCCATTVAWPHDPAVVDFHAAEGRSWRLRLSAEGARAERLPVDRAAAPDATAPDAAESYAAAPDAADVAARGTAAELVLTFYGRTPLDALALDGDHEILDRLAEWEPE
ncbi:hypothetical protein RVR_714 [Actinacidiphila reveromycinica]|uniref:Maleylpyruvate isomerase family mycothiol-dependent enzyme n=1 Tax=Actinacidiphila reveromycinica TaxID=659352 RepID=A0A7U3UNE8_9ACTN|nr:maleylpyruvate isomerase family mycothiol-dependent enzyme [Streptomyces sp. SN-593]BBA95731.1 hypothetical protein RVR_714 [Streptomyces sp. SN-593]